MEGVFHMVVEVVVLVAPDSQRESGHVVVVWVRWEWDLLCACMSDRSKLRLAPCSVATDLACHHRTRNRSTASLVPVEDVPL